MYFNSLKITLRTLLRQKGYSAINLIGLAFGIACFILISLWVFDELSFDNFHEHANRIYRVNTRTGGSRIVTASSWRLGPALSRDYPDIEKYTRVWKSAHSLIKCRDKVFDEQNIYLADSTFFSIFSFRFVEGEPKNSLSDRFSIVITHATAQRYFGNDNPIGKQLYFKAFDRDFRVAGVIEDVPSNSSLKFDIIARVDLMPQQRMESWEFTGDTFVLLDKRSDKTTLESKIKKFYKENMNDESAHIPVLQPLTQLHLYADGRPGLIKLVYVFSIIGIFILLIACINFMNLSTARATKRAKEVGIRKVTGAARQQLMIQFIGESTLISIFALLLSLAIAQLMLPAMNALSGKMLSLTTSLSINIVILLIGVVLFIGIVVGSYPALVLSSFQPVTALQESKMPRSRSKRFRHALTVLQFVISIALIIGTLVVQRQLHFLQSNSFGINREFIIELPDNSDLNQSFANYQHELLNHPSILSATSSQNQPVNVNNFIGINWEGHWDEAQLGVAYSTVGVDYFKTFDMQIVEGRPFSRAFSSDETEACIINETARQLMQLDNPLGKQVYFNHPAFPEEYKYVKIVGVVNDYHYRSLHEKIGPLIIRMHQPFQSYIYLKINPGNISEIMNYVERITKRFAPDFPFRFTFLDNTYQQLYETETRFSMILKAFAFLAIFISCLGLFALVSFSIEQRTKEIGIRKVLGATVPGIVLLLSQNITKWILIALIIASPLAWYTMNKWLENFAYRISIEWWVFAVAGITTLGIALLTVCWQALRAATANPVKTLKYE